MKTLIQFLLASLLVVPAVACATKITQGEMAAYIFGPAEILHRAWTKDRNYLAPPDVGTLASLDPALILTPPRGMEAGYVPIATRQELTGSAVRPHDHGKTRP